MASSHFNISKIEYTRPFYLVYHYFVSYLQLYLDLLVVFGLCIQRERERDYYSYSRFLGFLNVKK